MFGIENLAKMRKVVVVARHHCRSPEVARSILEDAFAHHLEWQRLVEDYVWDEDRRIHKVYFRLKGFGFKGSGAIEITSRTVVYQVEAPAVALAAAVTLLTFLPKGAGKNTLEDIVQDMIEELFRAAKAA